MANILDPGTGVGSGSGSGSGGSATGGSGPGVNGGPVVGYALAGVLAIILADFAPTLINGMLGLILAGMILKGSNTLAPQIQSWAASLGGGAATKG